MPVTEKSSGAPSAALSLLQPGRNCWRIEHADRFSMLVDADIYFRAVREAIRAARHSIFILSWDIDSRIRLVPEGANDGFPEPLGDFLHAVVQSRPGLRAYVLNWDFAMLYALEREWLPAYKLGWRTHHRLAFHMDGHHPVGGSHHQKVVVIDDKLAFVGGLDLTRARWDTSEHACNSPLRHDSDGKPHDPFHDVQAMVDGDVARALGELARQRWQRATGMEPVTATIERARDPWPAQIAPDLTDIDVAIARTEPAFDGQIGVFEVRQLHLDAIANARHHLFFENQYFTSDLICNALSARLMQEHAPEVMIVSPHNQSGWLEQATMGVLRARVHHRLKEADRIGRYRMYCPTLPGLKESSCLNVHSKVFTMDDDLISIGSANLSNRSMAFDTECNLVIEASGHEDRRAAIARLRNRLLAEHLATEPDEVAAATRRTGSLHAAVDALRQPGRSMIVFDPVTTPELEALIPSQAVFDPEKPIDPDELVEQFVPEDARRPVPRRMIGLGTLAVALALFAVAWRWTPLSEWVNLASLVSLARGLEALPFTPVAVICSYAIAGLVMVPVTLLIGVTGIVFGPVAGAFYAIGGTLLSAAVTYGLGRWLGRDTVHQLVGPRINRLSRRIARRGIIAMIIVRMLPIAPFTVVNVIAGASHIRFRDYMLGTLLGMTPGIIITVTFVHHLAEAIRNPSPGTIAVLALVAALLIGSALGLQRLFTRKDNVEAR
ncbi:VTT domain-containing protein [Noviherbaspirillum sp.]|uniref:VTT domain-containing protein n=1 Tax=Noviherbaspirillum sp. TaxID=1926288 RepID=UPI002FE10B4B